VRDYFDPLPRESRTVAHDLAARGYDTAWFGKWHLAERDRTAPLVGEAHARMIVPPEARGGFEFWEGFEGGFLLNDPWLHGTRLPMPYPFPGYQSDVLCARAGEWLADRRSRGVDRPVFCVVSLEPPHPPYAAPASGVEPRDPEALTLAGNVPRGGAVEVRVRRELAGYYAHIEATDRAIGGLVASVPEPTCVVWTSVHGDMHGAHGLFRKGWPHDESVRVPLVVREGGACGRRGVVERSPVSLLDLREMALAWADGRSWKCARESAPISMPSVVALPDQCDRTWSGERSATRKVVRSTDGEPWLEFDLRTDPLELRNLAVRSGLGRSAS
jgi:arylsulfatase A-like enzyme